MAAPHSFFVRNFRMPPKNPFGAGRVLHVERLGVGILRPGADVVQLQVGERRHVHHSVLVRLQPRLRQFVAGEVHAETGASPIRKLPGGLNGLGSE